MPTIILSYRRDDTGAIAGRIFDRLAGHYGADQVFMDIDSIPIGLDFREHIQETLMRCDVLLAVVGRHWAAPDHKGGFRISEENDWVRIEVEAALVKKIPVIPVLIDDAVLPPAASLPEGLRGLAFRQAALVNSGRDFHPHMDRLIKAMDRLLQAAPLGDTKPEVKPLPKPEPKPEVKPEPKPKVAASSTLGPKVRPSEHTAQPPVVADKPQDDDTVLADEGASKSSTSSGLGQKIWRLAVSPEGRLPRQTFAIGLIASFVLMHALTLAVGLPYNEITSHDGFPPFVLIFPVLWVWVVIALAAKRLHDLDWPGWPAAIPPFIGLAGTWTLLNTTDLAGWEFSISSFTAIILLLSPLGWMSGSKGPNRYGPDPTGGARADASMD
jgi:uncharacterized membrane protein YhaH (DUF805 family)